ncbi:hypothetical protein RKD45_005418 [Streptomyces griseus]
MSDVSGTNSADSDTAAVKDTAQKKAGEGVGLVTDKATTHVAGVARPAIKQVRGDCAGSGPPRRLGSGWPRPAVRVP